MATLLELQNQLRLKDEMIARLQQELQMKDHQIRELTCQLDKYQSVFSNNAPRRGRALGISAEPNKDKAMSERLSVSNGTPYSKTEPTRKLLRHAIQENDFMRNLGPGEIEEIVDYMQPVSCDPGEVVIREGDYGSQVYIMEDGIVSVSRGGLRKHEMTGATVFGELAILYNCTRTATVTAVNKCKLWAIERHCFQSIMMKSSLQHRQKHVNFLKGVPSLGELSTDILEKLADQLEEVHFACGQYIIRQGERGDTFYIITRGRVKVTVRRTVNVNNNNNNNNVLSENTDQVVEDPEQFIRFMETGEWFGEKALKGDDLRTASIVAISSDGVDCLSLDRVSYNQLIATIGSFEREYGDEELARKRAEEFMHLTVKDLRVIATLGVGGFGRVELVHILNDTTRSFALKQLKKQHIVETHQQEHILNERSILASANCEFIVKLYRTFKDRKYLYMLCEACLGGEIWSILRDHGHFDNNTARYYVACVSEALGYLHSRYIVYRDLKPENLLLNERGVCKLTDFGFAKDIHNGKKTWTFCGTPEYVAPEIILNKGHDMAADCWSLGILTFELMTGSPPFTASDPMRIYNIVLKGIEVAEFPYKMTYVAKDIIKKMCRDSPSERLGYGRNGMADLHKHEWFRGFDFEALRNGTMVAPIVRTVKSAVDASNFDEFPPDPETPPDDVTGWDKDF